MDEGRALEIVRVLADGINPATGEVFPLGSPYQQPDTIRALLVAAQTLERRCRYTRRRGELPGKAGRPWSDEDERCLLGEFEAGMSLPDLAVALQRTRAGIRARLQQLGKL